MEQKLLLKMSYVVGCIFDYPQNSSALPFMRSFTILKDKYAKDSINSIVS